MYGEKRCCLGLLKRNSVKMYFFWPLIYVFGQNDWQTESLSGLIILAGHCQLTGHFLVLCHYTDTR